MKEIFKNVVILNVLSTIVLTGCFNRNKTDINKNKLIEEILKEQKNQKIDPKVNEKCIKLKSQIEGLEQEIQEEEKKQKEQKKGGAFEKMKDLLSWPWRIAKEKTMKVIAKKLGIPDGLDLGKLLGGVADQPNKKLAALNVTLASQKIEIMNLLMVNKKYNDAISYIQKIEINQSTSASIDNVISKLLLIVMSNKDKVYNQINLKEKIDILYHYYTFNSGDLNCLKMFVLALNNIIKKENKNNIESALSNSNDENRQELYNIILDYLKPNSDILTDKVKDITSKIKKICKNIVAKTESSKDFGRDIYEFNVQTTQFQFLIMLALSKDKNELYKKPLIGMLKTFLGEMQNIMVESHAYKKYQEIAKEVNKLDKDKNTKAIQKILIDNQQLVKFMQIINILQSYIDEITQEKSVKVEEDKIYHIITNLDNIISNPESSPLFKYTKEQHPEEEDASILLSLIEELLGQIKSSILTSSFSLDKQKKIIRDVASKFNNITKSSISITEKQKQDVFRKVFWQVLKFIF